MVWTPASCVDQQCSLHSGYSQGLGLNLQHISDSLPTGSMAPAKVKKLVLLWH